MPPLYIIHVIPYLGYLGWASDRIIQAKSV